MIFLYILAAIVIIFIILFHSPFKIYVNCKDNKFSVNIQYLFLKKKLIPAKEKSTDSQYNPQKRKKKKKSKKTKTNKEDVRGKKKKNFFPEKNEDRIAFVINVMKSSRKALKCFTKRIKIKDIRADIDISDEDACECAVKFGKVNIAVYNIISFASCFFRVKKKYFNINCVYNKPESVYNFSFIVKFTPSAGILSVIAFIFTFLVNNKKVKKQIYDDS